MRGYPLANDWGHARSPNGHAPERLNLTVYRSAGPDEVILHYENSRYNQIFLATYLVGAQARSIRGVESKSSNSHFSNSETPDYAKAKYL